MTLKCRFVELDAPNGLVRAELTLGAPLHHAPSWDVFDVRAAPARALDGATTGSDRLGGDALRFDASTGLLLNASFKVPDERGARVEHASWLDVPVTRGTLRLVGRAPFTRDAADARVFDREGGFLLGALAAPGRPEPRTRLRVAEDLDLLFEGPRYRGWVLIDPLDHLDVPPGAPRPPRPDPRTIAAYAAYYDRLDMDAIDGIMDGDDAVCGDLTRIHTEAVELASSVDGRAAPLARVLRDWLRRWARRPGF